VLAVVLIGVVSVAMSLAGLELGGRLGEAVQERSELLGAAVLAGVGAAILTGLL
jgi:putative Mn2+ efflux pump MntP